MVAVRIGTLLSWAPPRGCIRDSGCRCPPLAMHTGTNYTFTALALHNPIWPSGARFCLIRDLGRDLREMIKPDVTNASSSKNKEQQLNKLITNKHNIQPAGKLLPKMHLLEKLQHIQDGTKEEEKEEDDGMIMDCSFEERVSTPQFDH
ncbi:hypothetical protein LguiA_009776 [Lonicera macranthoides]